MKKTQFYLSLIKTIFGFFVVSITIVIVLLFNHFKNVYIETLQDNHLSALSQVRYSGAAMNDTVDTLMNQLSQDSSITKMLYYMDYEDMDTQLSFLTLNKYVTSIDLVHSILIYNASQNLICNSSKVGTKLDSFDESTDNTFVNYVLSNTLESTPFLRTLKEEDIYSYPIYFKNGTGVNDTSVIIVNVYASWLSDNIKLLSENQFDNILIVNENGKFMNSFSENNQIFMDYNYPEKLTQGEEKTIVDYIDGKKYLLSYVSDKDYLGWKYIGITSYDVVQTKLDTITVFLGIVYVLSVIFGILITMFISKWLNLPYIKLKEEVQNIETKYNKGYQTIKNATLMNLLLDKNSSKNKELIENLESYDIKILQYETYQIICIKIDGYISLIENNSFKDITLQKYGITNISLEIFHRYTNAEAVDIGNSDIIFILDSIEKSILEDAIQEIKTYLRTYFNISTTAFVSPVCNDLSKINELYHQNQRAYSYKFFNDQGNIIYTEDYVKYFEVPYQYKESDHQLFYDCIINNEIEKAKEVLCEIILSGKNCDASTFMNVPVKLAFQLNRAILTLNFGSEYFELFNISQFIETIQRKEYYSDVLAEFNNVLDQIYYENINRRSTQHEQLAFEAKNMIAKEYSNADLSVDNIAQQLNVSVSHLRQVFKNYYAVTMATYIRNYRMERAKELLLSTDEAISEISNMVGFINSNYFYTSFKKATGMTPLDFRMKYKNK